MRRSAIVPVLFIFAILLLSSAKPSSLWNLPGAQSETAHVTFEFSEVVKPSGDTRELAVAFHSINFLDADANSIELLVFGTPEANALQGEGWFGNEEWPGVGSFQWAGGPSKRASMQLQIPQDTAGLLFNITSIADGMWMNVTVDDELAATLRVDAHWPWGSQYWHSGYVPVGQITSVPAPAEEPEWIEGRYFPKFPLPSDKIFALPVTHDLYNHSFAWQPEFRINASYETMMALTLVGMQGVINRNGPSVYLNWFPSPNQASEFWIHLLRRHVDVVYLELDSLSAVNFLLRRYGSRFEGAVIYDPAVPDTINVATMLAGLENRVILAPEQVGLPGIPDFDSVTDLRQLVETEGWNASEEGKHQLYQWVYDNLWPQLEHRIIGVISPGPPTSRGIPPENTSFLPLGIASRDYIVALRLAALWLSPVEELQAGLFAQFLEEAPSPIPVFGFFGNDEWDTVALASSYGDWVPVITNGNSPVSVGSLTVLSGVRPELEPYRAEMNVDHLFATLGEGPVATIWSSDGDSMQYLLDRGFRNFPWDEVQGHRFGWTINPTLADLAPLVWNHYVESRFEVSLISGLSGAGYTHPQLMNDTQLRAYLAYAARYLNDTGLRGVVVQEWYGPFNEEIAATYYEVLRNTGYVGVFAGGWSHGLWGIGFGYKGVPTPGVPYSYTVNSTNSAWIIDDLLSHKPGEVFVDLTAYPWRSGQVVGDEDALGGEALLFSQEAPAGWVVWGPYAELAPGQYSVTFRLKVSENEATDPVAHVYVDQPDVGELVGMYVAPSDFEEAGKYQNFTLSFTLDRLTADLQFVIVYLGGTDPPAGSWASTDLFADYILATRKGGLDLPVFAGVLLVATWPENPEWLQLAEDLERSGFLVLHPDELLASLNPRFMIEWATPILGSEHPALDEARQKLVEGKFLTSLLVIREALRTLPEHAYLLHFEEKGIIYNISIQGNTWVAPLEYDEAAHQIKFSTHGPPEGTVQAFVTIPNELQDGLNIVNIDGQLHPFTSSQNETHTTISLQFGQGPHDVEIPIPALAPPDITNVSQIPAANNVLPEDEVKVNATVMDPNGVKRVVLNYTYTNSSGTWTGVVNMTNLEGSVWNATMPAFPYGTSVAYRIIAEDNVGNTVTTEDVGYEYQYTVIPEFPSFLILPLFMIATLLATTILRRKHST